MVESLFQKAHPTSDNDYTLTIFTPTIPPLLLYVFCPGRDHRFRFRAPSSRTRFSALIKNRDQTVGSRQTSAQPNDTHTPLQVTQQRNRKEERSPHNEKYDDDWTQEGNRRPQVTAQSRQLPIYTEQTWVNSLQKHIREAKYASGLNRLLRLWLLLLLLLLQLLLLANRGERWAHLHSNSGAPSIHRQNKRR